MLLLEGLAGTYKWGSAWSSHFHGGKTKALWKIKGHSYSWEENRDLLNQLTAYWIALVCDYSSCMESNVHQWWQRLGIYPVIAWLFSRLYRGVVAFSPLHDKSHRSNTGFWNLEFCRIKGKTVKKKKGSHISLPFSSFPSDFITNCRNLSCNFKAAQPRELIAAAWICRRNRAGSNCYHSLAVETYWKCRKSLVCIVFPDKFQFPCHYDGKKAEIWWMKLRLTVKQSNSFEELPDFSKGE